MMVTAVKAFQSCLERWNSLAGGDYLSMQKFTFSYHLSGRVLLLGLFLFALTAFPRSLGAELEKNLAAPPTTVVPLDIDEIPRQLSPKELSSRGELLIFYCVVILFSSMLGGYLPRLIKLTHTRIQILMSFVGGLMLGVALFHLLLHAVLDVPKSELNSVITSLGLGILTMFLLLRVFHFHQHDLSDDSVAAEQAQGHASCHEQAHQAHRHEQEPVLRSRFAWVGIAFGLGLHSIMDGVAVAVSTLRPPVGSEQLSFWGLATFLAVLLHKPLDAVSITSVMSVSGWRPSVCTAVNFSFALMCPLGALLAWWGIVGTHSHLYLMSHLLAFSAGIFFCISLSDLLPEMQFHAHNQWTLTFSLIAGLGLAWGLMWLDPVHGLQ